MAFHFYSDPQLMSSSTTHSETSLEEGKTLVIDLAYDRQTGILKAALIKSVDSNGATIGYSKYTLKSTNVSPGSLFAGEEGAQATTQANSAVSEGDWAIYKVTFYITRYDGDYIRGSISFKVIFHQGPYGVEYEFTDIQIESVDSNKPDQLNESTVNSFIQSIDYYTPMYIDPAELPADGVVEGSETYVDYRGEYFTDTGVLKSSSIELRSNEGEGQINVQIIQSSIASTESGGGVPETGEAAAAGDAGAQATPTIKEGDWAVYRVTFDLTDNEGNYAKGSMTLKVVFHEYSYGIDYEFTDYSVESYDSNTGETGESAVNEIISVAEYIAPIHVDPANLPPGGVIEQSTDYYSFRAEYDPNLGVLRSMTLTPKEQGTGHFTIELIDTSIAGLAPAANGLALGGLGGMTTIIIIVVIVAVVAVIAAIALKKRSRKPQYTYGQPQYGPPTPPPPPPQ